MGRLSVREVGARRQVRPASVTNPRGRRETAELVVRRTDRVDGRGVLVEVTDAGHALPELREKKVAARPWGRTPGRPAPVETPKPLRREAGDFPQ